MIDSSPIGNAIVAAGAAIIVLGIALWVWASDRKDGGE